MLTAVITTNDLPNLAREINDAHRQVRMHAKGMLLEAKRAGEALLVAKQQCKHGEFKAWVKAHCSVSYDTAKEYMRVARLGKGVDLHLFDGGIRAFLDAHAEPKAQPKAPKANPFTRVDAEHVMKLQRLADSTANENEAAVAQSKLDDFASRFDMTAEEAVVKSKEMLPFDHLPSSEAAIAEARAAEARVAAELRRRREAFEAYRMQVAEECRLAPREALIAMIARLRFERDHG